MIPNRRPSSCLSYPLQSSDSTWTLGDLFWVVGINAGGGLGTWDVLNLKAWGRVRWARQTFCVAPRPLELLGSGLWACQPSQAIIPSIITFQQSSVALAETIVKFCAAAIQ